MDVTVEVARRGQLTIPKQLREQFGIEQGDRYAVRAVAGGILVLTPRRGRANAALDELRSILREEGVTLADMLAELRRMRTEPEETRSGDQAAPPLG